MENNYKVKILVVDDRNENLIAMSKLLKKVNADIITVNSGEKALAESLKTRFALILLDVQMPDMDGFETAELLHKNKSTADIPIIFVTAINKDFKYISQGYKSGAVDYLSKPIVAEILLGKVQVFIKLEESRNKLTELTNKLYLANKRQNLLLENAQEGIIGIDNKGIITFINPKGCQTLCATSDNFIHTHISNYLFKTEDNQLEIAWKDSELYKQCFINKSNFQCSQTMLRINGDMFPAEYNIAALIDDKKLLHGAVLVFQDITVRKKMEDKLLQMAKYDSLTGLANRVLFKEFLTTSIARSVRRNKYTAILFLDLDDFKGINDTLGHDAGDLLLQNVANKLQKCIRDGDLAARLGGDEFAVILDDVAKPEDSIEVAKKILHQLSFPHNLQGEERYVGVSIGVASNNLKKETVEELVKKADLAMYDAKKHGKNTYSVFSEKLQNAS